MAITEFSKKYHEKMFPGYVSKFLETDPEFIERFDNFAFDEVINEEKAALDDKTRMTAILAALIGCQGIDEFRAMLSAALNFGVTAVEIKEITYQAVAYLGIGRVFPFLHAANEVLVKNGYELPLAGQETTSTENRLEKGSQAQVDIFGEVCGNSTNLAQRNPDISANGSRITVLVITIQEKVLITDNAR